MYKIQTLPFSNLPLLNQNRLQNKATKNNVAAIRRGGVANSIFFVTNSFSFYDIF